MVVKFGTKGVKSYQAPKKKKIEFGKKLIQNLKTNPAYRKKFFSK